MFVEGKSRTIFFPSNTLIYGIFRDGSKNINNTRTCEHLILGQLRMGARQAKNAPLYSIPCSLPNQAKLKFDQDFEARWLFCFCCWTEITLFVESTNFTACGFALQVSFLYGSLQPKVEAIWLNAVVPLTMFWINYLVICCSPHQCSPALGETW